MLIHERKFSGFLCQSFDAAIARLGIALDQAKSKGFTEHPAYKEAKDYYDRESSFWSGGSDGLFGVGNCTDATNEANRLIGSVNKLMDSPTITPSTYRVGSIQPTSLTKPAEAFGGWIKTVAIAGAVIAASYVAYPIVKAVLPKRNR